MRYQVVFALADALKKSSDIMGVAGLATRLSINEEHLRRLIRGSWTDVTLDQLQRLSTWARKQKIDPTPFKVIEHPLWSTFSDHKAEIFIGVNSADYKSATNDYKAKAELAQFFEQDHVIVADPKVEPPTVEGRANLVEKVRHAMKTTNCVFLCGPLRNPASEVATALLWKAEPFDASAPNQWKVPFHITYYRRHQEQQLASAFSTLDSGMQKRRVRVRMDSAVWTLPFPFRKQEDWEPKSEQGLFDYAVVAICRKPLETTANVSTVIVMGVTGFATRSACESIARERLHLSSLQDGVPQIRMFCARFRKGFGEDERETTDGCRWVGDPWDTWPHKSGVREKGDLSSW